MIPEAKAVNKEIRENEEIRMNEEILNEEELENVVGGLEVEAVTGIKPAGISFGTKVPKWTTRQ